jgi:zinc transporter, ZIP family
LESSLNNRGHEEAKRGEEEKKLTALGYNTALAIGLHNFPEGLATFVTALEDPKVGAVLAIAIAIHNIPEGLCVSLPIYYATGSRTKGFMWGVLSGVSEIVAAILGWIILASLFSSITYAIMFGIVAGMMVIISVHQLLPTAHFYDPENKCVTYCFIGGMATLALSLVLFKI